MLKRCQVNKLFFTILCMWFLCHTWYIHNKILDILGFLLFHLYFLFLLLIIDKFNIELYSNILFSIFLWFFGMFLFNFSFLLKLIHRYFTKHWNIILHNINYFTKVSRSLNFFWGCKIYKFFIIACNYRCCKIVLNWFELLLDLIDFGLISFLLWLSCLFFFPRMSYICHKWWSWIFCRYIDIWLVMN